MYIRRLGPAFAESWIEPGHLAFPHFLLLILPHPAQPRLLFYLFSLLVPHRYLLKLVLLTSLNTISLILVPAMLVLQTSASFMMPIILSMWLMLVAVYVFWRFLLRLFRLLPARLRAALLWLPTTKYVLQSRTTTLMLTILSV